MAADLLLYSGSGNVCKEAAALSFFYLLSFYKKIFGKNRALLTNHGGDFISLFGYG